MDEFAIDEWYPVAISDDGPPFAREVVGTEEWTPEVMAVMTTAWIKAN